MYTFSKLKVGTLKPVFGFLGRFGLPKAKLHIGPDTANQIGKLLKLEKSKSVLIVTDEVLFSLGLLDGMLDSIKAEGIKVSIFKGVKPDPTYAIVEAGMAVCKENACDSVVAFGGGSTLDAAKAIASAAANKYKNPRKLEGLMKVRKKPLTFISVPTTAGTGSEVTIVAVVSDDVTHQKGTIVSPKIISKHAVLDPKLTTGLPSHITTTTGLDALTHAVEAYVSGYANGLTNKYALKAIRLLNDNLEKAMKNPGDLQAREDLLVGSLYAGMAFTRTYVGYVHAFSHNIGGKYGVPHGLGNAVLLPHVMEVSKRKSLKRFAKLSDFLDLAPNTSTKSEKADAFIKYLFDLNKKLEIPETLKDFPEDGIDNIITLAFKEAHGTYPVPKYLSRQEAKELLLKVCNK